MAALMTCGFGPRDRLAILGPEWTLGRQLHHLLGLYKSEVIPLPVTADWQLKRLKELDPTVVWTYPSVLRSLIHNLDFPIRELIRPRVVITFAEIFDPVLRKRVEAELDPEFFSLYGATEFGRIAWECPEHEGLHLNASHFVLECVDDPLLPDLEGAGVAVLTNLFGYAMPFIRYKLGDICLFPNATCSCGCTFPLMDPPIGREDDILMLPNGEIKSANGFHHIIARFDGIDQWRVIQETESDFVVQLVMPNKPDEEMFNKIREEFVHYLEVPTTLNIRLMDFMEEEALTFRTFISKVPRSKQ
jgi:phenylacetate-CoA ligase